MNYKAFFPILNVGKVVVFGMRKDHKLNVGLEIDGEIVSKEMCDLRNDEKYNSKLYFIFNTTRYYLDWFTAV